MIFCQKNHNHKKYPGKRNDIESLLKGQVRMVLNMIDNFEIILWRPGAALELNIKNDFD